MNQSFTPSPQVEDPAFQQDLWDSLNAMGEPRSAAAGSVLFREGDPGKGLFLLHKGTVRLSIGKNDKSITYRIVNPPHILGLPATVQERPYSLTAEVLEDAELLFVDSGKALEYLRHNTAMCMRVLEVLSHEMVWARYIHGAHVGESRNTGS